MIFLRYWCVLLLCAGIAASAWAHQSGNSYVRIVSDEASFRVQLDFAVRDLNSLLQIPPAEQKEITREQLSALQERLAAVVAASLVIDADGEPVALTFQSQEVVLHNDGLYVRQHHGADPIDASAAYLLVRYGFFNEDEKIARAFGKLSANQLETSTVFDARHAVQRMPLREISLYEILWSYAREGTLHIWSGFDHVLFLICLLLPGLSLAQGSSRPMLTYALKIITAFTIAHSLTLGAAALDWVVLPDRLIEAAIAASILISALLNLFNKVKQAQWKLAFGFGLIHGLGFANGLRELGLSSTHFIETLLAFNLGVEFGQLVIVLAVGALVSPLLHSAQWIYRLQRWGSVAIVLIAAFWLVERISG